MGLFEKIFGGGEQKRESTSKTGKQRQTLNQLLDTYRPEIGKGQDIYTGERVAPLTGAQQTALGGLGGFVPYAGPTDPSAIPLNTEAQAALGGVLTGEAGATPWTQEGIESFYNRAIAAPAMRNFQKFIKPEIRESFAGPGFWSGARATEQARAGEQLGSQLSERRGQLEFDVEQANKQLAEQQANRALSGIAAQGQFARQPGDIAQQGLQTRGQIASLSGLSQQQAQSEINSAIQKFAEENRLTDPEDLQILMQLLGMNFQRSESYGYSTPGALKGIESLAKGAGGIKALFA